MGALVLVAAAACSPAVEPVTITYAADGAGQVEVTYALDGETVTEVVDTPWELELEVQGSYRLHLITRNLGDRGRVACAIVADEVAEEPIRTIGEAGAECGANVERRGGGVEGSAFTTTHEFEDESDAVEGDDAV